MKKTISAISLLIASGSALANSVNALSPCPLPEKMIYYINLNYNEAILDQIEVDLIPSRCGYSGSANSSIKDKPANEICPIIHNQIAAGLRLNLNKWQCNESSGSFLFSFADN